MFKQLWVLCIQYQYLFVIGHHELWDQSLNSSISFSFSSPPSSSFSFSFLILHRHLSPPPSSRTFKVYINSKRSYCNFNPSLRVILQRVAGEMKEVYYLLLLLLPRLHKPSISQTKLINGPATMPLLLLRSWAKSLARGFLRPLQYTCISILLAKVNVKDGVRVTPFCPPVGKGKVTACGTIYFHKFKGPTFGGGDYWFPTNDATNQNKKFNRLSHTIDRIRLLPGILWRNEKTLHFFTPKHTTPFRAIMRNRRGASVNTGEIYLQAACTLWRRVLYFVSLTQWCFYLLRQRDLSTISPGCLLSGWLSWEKYDDDDDDDGLLEGYV